MGVDASVGCSALTGGADVALLLREELRAQPGSNVLPEHLQVRAAGAVRREELLGAVRSALLVVHSDDVAQLMEDAAVVNRGAAPPRVQVCLLVVPREANGRVARRDVADAHLETGRPRIGLLRKADAGHEHVLPGGVPEDLPRDAIHVAAEVVGDVDVPLARLLGPGPAAGARVGEAGGEPTAPADAAGLLANIPNVLAMVGILAEVPELAARRRLPVHGEASPCFIAAEAQSPARRLLRSPAVRQHRLDGPARARRASRVLLAAHARLALDDRVDVAHVANTHLIELERHRFCRHRTGVLPRKQPAPGVPLLQPAREVDHLGAVGRLAPDCLVSLRGSASALHTVVSEMLRQHLPRGQWDDAVLVQPLGQTENHAVGVALPVLQHPAVEGQTAGARALGSCTLSLHAPEVLEGDMGLVRVRRVRG
mmetsp:Transcript_70044/g.208752  ORF Transcript_70044/g.208752 Transcript_70044/m.208752 type:complete len:427 (+) Transcript_70044:894-2174(+)